MWLQCSAINSYMITTANIRLGLLQLQWSSIVEVDADGIICHVGNASSGTSATVQEVDLTGSYIIPVSASMQRLHGHRLHHTQQGAPGYCHSTIRLCACRACAGLLARPYNNIISCSHVSPDPSLSNSSL